MKTFTRWRMVVTAVLTVLNFYAAYVKGFNFFGLIDPELMKLQPFMATIVLLVLGEWIKTYVDHDEQGVRHTEVVTKLGELHAQINALTTSPLVEQVGDDQTAAIRIAEALKTANDVRNTWVSWPSRPRHGAEIEHITLDAQMNAMRANTVWHDLLSVDHRERIERIRASCDTRDYTATLIPGELRDFPMINLEIIEHTKASGKPTEVFFSWVDKEVFRSTHPAIIKLFSDYFTRTVEFCKPHQAFRRAIHGWWIEVTRCPPNGVSRVALVHIATEDVLSVKVHQYDTQGHFSGSFTSKTASIVNGTELWFAFQQPAHGVPSVHGARYSFDCDSSRDRHEYDASYIDSGSGNLWQISGSRLGPEDHIFLESANMRSPPDRLRRLVTDHLKGVARLESQLV